MRLGGLVSAARRPGLWLVGLSFLVYNANLSFGACGQDDLIFRYLPLGVLRHGTLTMNPYAAAFTEGSGLHYSVMDVGGDLVSTYPLATGLLAIPVFLVPALLWENLPLALLAKVAGSSMAALSVGVVYATLRRLGATRQQAFLLGGIFALATPVFSIAGQALCQHAPGTLFLALTVYCVARAREERGIWVPLAGLAAGVTIAIRPQLAAGVLPVVGVLFLFLLESARERTELALGTIVPLHAVLVYNVVATGHVLGGYALFPERFPYAHLQGDILEGLGGLLLSPGRGLFLFVPVAVFAVVGAVRAVRERHWILLGGLAGIVLTLLLYSRLSRWWGGFTYGPRYLTEVMVFVVLLMWPLFWRPSLLRSRIWGWVFGLLVAGSVFIHTVGAFGYPCSWDVKPVDVDRQPDRVWNWTDTPVTRCFSEGLDIVGPNFFRPVDLGENDP